MFIPADLLEEEYVLRASTPSDINEHLPALRALAQECAHVTEFGVFIGNATLGLLAGKPHVLIGYDIPETYQYSSVQKAVARIKELAELNNVSYAYILGNVHEVTIEDTDFMFLDTNQREKTIDELNRHHTKVRKYIGSHDTVYLPSQLAAFEEFLRQHADEWRLKAHYTNNNGLIVIERVPK